MVVRNGKEKKRAAVAHGLQQYIPRVGWQGQHSAVSRLRAVPIGGRLGSIALNYTVSVDWPIKESDALFNRSSLFERKIRRSERAYLR
jgi:hypothetical protein